MIHTSDEIGEMSSETIRDRLRRLRKVAGFTQGQLAAKAQVSQGTIGNLESGVRGYGESIVDIARALNVTPDFLRCTQNADDGQAIAGPRAQSLSSDDSSIRSALELVIYKLSLLEGAELLQANVVLKALIDKPDYLEAAVVALERPKATKSGEIDPEAQRSNRRA